MRPSLLNAGGINFMDTESQVTDQDVQPDSLETEESTTTPEVVTTVEGDQGKPPEPVQESSSIATKQERQYSQSEVSKLQSTFTKRINRLQQENRLAQAAIQSRIAKPIDPSDPSTSLPTPEEVAHRKLRQEIDAEDRAEAMQSLQQQQVQAIGVSLWTRLQSAGIDPASKEAAERVGKLYESGDTEGARIEAAAMIAEKRLADKTKPKIDPAVQARQKAKEEGAFTLGGDGKGANLGKRTYTQEEVADYDFFIKNKESILLAQREGRIK
jgi:hypothetical protein